jgi:deoxyadenosine/deoxycytidine kinase
MSIQNKHYIFSVEGNIGSGKSTFLKMLKNHLPKQFNQLPVVFLQEPVDKWMKIKDKEGETILSKFYRDTKKYAFSFQMMAYVSRLSILRETIANYPDGAIIISERCLKTDKMVFAKMLYDDEQIEDVNYQIYQMWFNDFNIPTTGHIYIHSEPTTAHERVQKRSREGEDVIALEYLSKCHNYHEMMMQSISHENKIKFDTVDMKFDFNSYQNWIECVCNFIQQKTSHAKTQTVEVSKENNITNNITNNDIIMLSYS